MQHPGLHLEPVRDGLLDAATPRGVHLRLPRSARPWRDHAMLAHSPPDARQGAAGAMMIPGDGSLEGEETPDGRAEALVVAAAGDGPLCGGGSALRRRRVAGLAA